MITVLVVDDEELVCAHLSTILAADGDIGVVAAAHDGAAAVEAALAHRPAVVLMDLRMPGVGGIAAIRRILDLGLPCRVVALTSFDDDALVLGALHAGAAGYLLKSTPPPELRAAVRVLAGGRAVLSESALQRLLRGRGGGDPAVRAAVERLTPRERDVLRLLGAGRTNAQIAGSLHLSETTVKGYVSSTLDKLGVVNRTQAGLVAHAYLD